MTRHFFGIVAALGIGFIASRATAQPGGDPFAASSAPLLEIEGEGINGDTVRLSDFRRKYVLVEVWAPWAPACPRTSKQIMRFARKMRKAKKSIRLIRYALDSDRERWMASIATTKRPPRWIVNVRDPWGHLSPLKERLEINQLPYLLVFSPKGELLYRGTDVQAALATTMDYVKGKRKR